MARWLDTWLGLWRWHHVRIASPLRPAVAVVRLRQAVAELPRAVTAPGRIHWFRVRDRSRGVDVVLHVTSNRRGGMTVIRARVVATETGCDLVGAYGWSRGTRAFWAYGLSFVVLFWSLAVVAVRSPVAGTGSVLPSYVLPPGMLLFLFVISTASVVEGRRDALIALDHIARRLDASS
jgi:hypothetical protein